MIAPIRRLLPVLYLLFISSALAAVASAQGVLNFPRATPARQSAAPVVVEDDTLFHVDQSLGDLPPAERAAEIAERLKEVFASSKLGKDSVRVVEDSASTAIFVGDKRILTVLPADAGYDLANSRKLAAQLGAIIQTRIDRETEVASWRDIGIGFLLALLVSAILIALVKLLNRIILKLQSKLREWQAEKIPALKIQNYELASSLRVTDALVWLSKVFRIAAILVLLYFYIPLLFSFFPWTRDFASTLFDYVLTPVRLVFSGLVSYLPNLFFIVVIVVGAYLVLGVIRRIFIAIARGYITFSGFYRDWAIPTYKIVRFLIIAFALVLVFPYLPGSSSPAFRGISIFFGLLLSLGSTSAVANVVAGIVITYMRPFKVGDRVKIADTTGDVIAKTLLVTRIQTIKNVEVTIPNATVLGSHIINYSASATDDGLILHTEVSIGYDVPRKTVRELLLAAARTTEDVEQSPEPFVLQTSLNDSHVTYELNVITRNSHEMARISSDLHGNILDSFNEAGIEIMSPAYTSLRDGNTSTVPQQNRPAGYTPPGFRIWPFGQSSKSE